MKKVTIIAEFPEIKGGCYHQRGEGTGTNKSSAARAALKQLFDSPTLKRKRYQQFNATFIISEAPDAEDQGQETEAQTQDTLVS